MDFDHREIFLNSKVKHFSPAAELFLEELFSALLLDTLDDFQIVNKHRRLKSHHKENWGFPKVSLATFTLLPC